ncbi:class I SAM-dependent methyltransferase [Bacillus sp. 03113]|uniref:class I SAM-dependent methyltransferase n=1 Tax=Bacillus sp. 03113 TaxID=2578211 RepID=UPI0011419ED9|nr:class I SAM-dependent methyltransferase [Bacillus sp. 03113]
MNKADIGKIVKNYTRTKKDIPNSFFESLQLRNILINGKKIADIGCGTGILTRKIKLRNGNVVGVDPSFELLQEAKSSNDIHRLNIPYYNGSAENTGLEANEYDVVTVMRAWNWFDRNEALNEIRRILKKDGTLIVADSSFIAAHPVVQTTISFFQDVFQIHLVPAGSKAISKQLINGYPVEWFTEWQNSGFELRDFYKLDYDISFTNKEWADRVSSRSYFTELEESQRSFAKNQLLMELDNKFGTEMVHTIPHACYVCVLKKI